MDPDRMVEDALRQMRAVEDFQARAAAMVGRGEALGGLVTAEARGDGGLSAITIDPRAMRTPAQDLGDATLAAARAALEDLQQQTMAAMQDVVGDEVMDALTGKTDPTKLMAEAEQKFRMSADDALAELDKLRRQGGY
ncbi:YbaB/EbfC family nucleoid-associated protein [Dactylosporangium sp. AC04546]|uniref:YbaB/EbfC family nucleoid-associated protein n=1 Tax=Dactylosporangium sp. AC04546 TaxID=2862460 RepID=UPI001EDE7621|nr:YbaB/EbfC family nucleoid-associated protein [Dactylosporangium sp. AC04546]WVK81418.1 YbaB/EbfC family nucleoid-associated protein [Dactylosporangium sp. AC04546]